MCAYYIATMPRQSILQSSSTFYLWQANNNRQRELRQLLSEVGLTYVEYVVLVALVVDMNKRAMNQQQLIRHIKVDKTMASQVLRSLEKKQLVSRRKGIMDGRAISLHVTSRGINLANKAVEAVATADKQFDLSL